MGAGSLCYDSAEISNYLGVPASARSDHLLVCRNECTHTAVLWRGGLPGVSLRCHIVRAVGVLPCAVGARVGDTPGVGKIRQYQHQLVRPTVAG